MSTATPPATTETQRADWQRKVRDPLERLRGAIRMYVTIEGAAVLAMYLALWFWIGMVLDYGFFRAFSVDWVQVLPWNFRLGVLVVLIAGLLAVVVLKISLRLMREFQDSSLALVLERRFPKLLGDRLITAVELADPKLAQTCGYSQSMIDQTIGEAVARVDQIPVSEAFNWKRLTKYGWLVAGLTLGLFVLTGAGYAATTSPSMGDYFTSFRNVSTIWFERNVLLQNVIWPRQAHLELVGFPENGELRVGRNIATAPIRVRALKWVYADPHAPEGWRPLRWSDLSGDFVQAWVPPLPGEWQQYGDMTVDAVELQLEKDNGSLNSETVIKFRDFFPKLEDQAAQPAMARRMRKLEVPDDVMVYYKGDTIRSEMTLKKEGDNEYSGLFTDLKETVQFQACAKDYCTATKTITVVPPPALAQLLREEAQPAYLHHRGPAGQGSEGLKGLKQQFAAEKVYLGGETSRIDLPAGTDLVLTGTADKDLASVQLVPRKDRFSKTPDGKPVEGPKYPEVTLQGDKRTFAARFDNVTRRYDFEFEFKDTDGVTARRHIIIQPTEDIGPDIEVVLATIRKTPQGYMITANAMVPFEGRVRDDHGLDKLDYQFVTSRVEETGVNRTRATLAAMVTHLMPSPIGFEPLTAAPFLGLLQKLVEPTGGEEERPPQVAALSTFQQKQQAIARGDVSRDELIKRLKGGKVGVKPLIREHVLDPDAENFDLQKHLPSLKVTGEGVQPRYRLRLWLSANDNNVETGPKVGESKERFNLIVVGDTELLAEIAKEEEALHLKLEATFNQLQDARAKLDQIGTYVSAPDFDVKQMSALATRALEIAETIAGGSVSASEVFGDYSRILKELKTNRLNDMVKKVDSIVKLLDSLKNGEFVRAEEAEREFQKALDKGKYDPALAATAKQRMDELLAKLQEALQQMGELTDINRLITTLQSIESEQRDNVAVLKLIRQRLEDLIFKDDK